MKADSLHGMTSECPADFLASLESLAFPNTDQKILLPKETLKDLRPLGHEISLWANAAEQLALRVSKDRYPTDLNAFLKMWLPALPIRPPKEDFHLLLGQSDLGWQISGSSLPWMHNSTYAALLQIPALKSSWISSLRASHFDHLLRLLPASWLMDPTPLPPGCVIPGLQIATWADLVRLRGRQRNFKIYSADSTFTLSDQQSISEWQKSSMSPPPAVLVEQRNSTAWILVRYEQRAGEIHLAGTWFSQNELIFIAQ